MVRTKARTIPAVLLLTGAVLVFWGCGKKEEQPPARVAGPAAEVRKLVEETKRHAEALKAQPGGPGAAQDQLARLTGLLEQLLRHLEEKAQVQQQGGDVAKSDAQIATDLAQVQEIQTALAAPPGEQGTPEPGGQTKPVLDLISENLTKITQIVQQGRELAALLKKPREKAEDPSILAPGGASEGIPPADGTQAPGLPESGTATTGTASSTGESSSGASTPGGPGILAQAGGKPTPLTRGYESVVMEAWPYGTRLQVTVNGLLVAAYDDHTKLLLDSFLTPGAMNTVTFTFDRKTKRGMPTPAVHLGVKMPGNDQWRTILKFVHSDEKWEDTFQVPFVGATK